MQPFYENQLNRMRVSLYTGFAFPQHLHTQLEMMILRSGSAQMCVDGQVYQMNAGDLMLVFPNVVHGYHHSDAGAHGLMLILGSESAGDFHRRLVSSSPMSPLIARERLHPDVERVAQAIEDEYLAGGDEAVQRAYAQVLLARALPLLQLAPRSGGEQELLRRAMGYLAEHWQQPLTLGEVAQHLGVSKYHLSHLFSSRLHTNFRAYVNALRVEHAQRLLRGTDRSITDICYECGFESQRTFNRAFLQLVGTTPRMYRLYPSGAPQ